MRGQPSLQIPNVEFHYPYNLEFPTELRLAVRRAGVRFTRYALMVSVLAQRMYLYEQRAHDDLFPLYGLNERFLISTSAFGVSRDLMQSSQF